MKLRDFVEPPPEKVRTLAHLEPLELRLSAKALTDAELQADARGFSLSRLVSEALKFTRLFSPAEWRLWEAAAAERGLSVLALFRAILEDWKRKEISR